MIDLKEISELLHQRSEEIFPQCSSWTASDWFLELTGEIGEAANIIKKLNRGDQNHEELYLKLQDEFSDIFLCLLLNSFYHNIDLEKSIPIKFNRSSRDRGSKTRLEPKFPGKIENADPVEIEVYGLSVAQIRALIIYYQNEEGVDLITIRNSSPETIAKEARG